MAERQRAPRPANPFGDLDGDGHIKPVNGTRKKIPVWTESMAMDLALKGSTIRWLAQKYKKTPHTICYWKKQPEIQKLILKIKDDYYEKALNRYQSLSGIAVEVLARYLGWNPETEEFEETHLNPEVRQVAQSVVKGVGIHKQESKINLHDDSQDLTEEDEKRIDKELKEFFIDHDKRKKKRVSEKTSSDIVASD